MLLSCADVLEKNSTNSRLPFYRMNMRYCLCEDLLSVVADIGLLYNFSFTIAVNVYI